MTQPTHASDALTATAGVRSPSPQAPKTGLYTPDERLRRDATKWTLVQGILAPVQFLVMAVSVWLVLRYLRTGDGLAAAGGESFDRAADAGGGRVLRPR